jgi:hypothetical protein
MNEIDPSTACVSGFRLVANIQASGSRKSRATAESPAYASTDPGRGRAVTSG